MLALNLHSHFQANEKVEVKVERTKEGVVIFSFNLLLIFKLISILHSFYLNHLNSFLATDSVKPTVYLRS